MSRIGDAVRVLRGHPNVSDPEEPLMPAELVTWSNRNGLAAADLVKVVREGGTIRDLSQVAAGRAPLTQMGAAWSMDDPDFDTGQMGPGRPAEPFPLGGEPRQWQYRVGRNLAVPPDADRGVDTALLRTLADSYDLLRKCIEVMKNEISALEWDLVPTEKNRKKREQWIAENGAELERIKQFFLWPEAYMARTGDGRWVRRGMVSWKPWLKALLEDYYVLDALTIWPRTMLNGELLAFDRVDGSTVKPVTDLSGRVPPPPLPAYQQYMYGVPRASFTVEELIYRPANVRNHSPYGFSHVEQMLITINLCLRYQVWNTQAFTDGALPLGLLEFPEGYTADQIQAIIDVLNTATSGLADSRQQFHGVPDGTRWNPIKPFQWDESFAQYLVEYTCALFGLNAQKLGFMPARGGAGLGGSGFAEQQAENTDSHELIPTARWVRGLMGELIERFFGRTDIEFVFTGLDDQDEKTQIETDQAAMQAGIKSLDQVLQERGEDPEGVGRIVWASNGIPWTVADLKAIQDGEERTAAPGLPASDEPEPRQPSVVPGGTPPGVGGPDGGQRALPAPQGDSATSGQPTKPDPHDDDTADSPDTGKLDTSSGLQPHGLGAPRSRVDELRAWKRKAVRDVREGRPPRPFRSDLIPDEMNTMIADRIASASLDEVRGVFNNQIAKAATPTVQVAGICVVADDTGRVLMLQRSICDDTDPAAGMWEFPGGHLDDGEQPQAGAVREWQEETGVRLPAGEFRGGWRNGIYQGFVYAVPSEQDVPINTDFDQRDVKNPDDPDGDQIETCAWWDPDDLEGMAALRPELADTPEAFHAIDRAVPAKGKAAAAGPSPRTRKQRTEKIERASEAALAQLLLTKRRNARRAATAGDAQNALGLDPSEVAGLGRTLAQHRAAAYMVGANLMLHRLSQPPLDTMPLDDEVMVADRALDLARRFNTDYQAQLGKLLTTTPEAGAVTVGRLVDGVARFQQWKARQAAVDNATGGYNTGALAVANREGLSSVIWSTENDGRVCEECADRDGQVFTTVDATAMGDEGLHNGCRCEWELNADTLGGGGFD